MPIEYQIRKELKLAIFSHIGTVPDEEFLKTYERVFSEPDFDISFNLLIDLTKADSSERSSNALRTMAEANMERLANTDHSPRVAVVTTDDLSYGLSRMYNMYASGVPGEFAVFKSAHLAQAWLELPDNISLFD